MSDRIAILRGGHVEQVGAPEEVYTRPATRFVAEFLGEANLLPAAHAMAIGFAGRDDERLSGSGTAVVRPEHCTLGGPEESGARGTVDGVSYQGVRNRVVVRVQGLPLVVSVPTDENLPVRVGDNVTVRAIPGRLHVIAEDAPAAPDPIAA
jgi:putative spermidine/putrescine transport system ATP-binding protein